MAPAAMVRAPMPRSGPATSRAMSSSRAAMLSLIPYKTPWNLLPFYVVAFALAGFGFAALVEMPRSRAMRGAVAAALTIAVAPAGTTGVARRRDLRGRPAQPVRLRADRPRRRAHGHAHPRSRPRFTERPAHAGLGDRTAVRAVAAPVVSADDAERRLLDGAG